MHRRELELELIQTNKAQKPALRVKVEARALRVRSVSREDAWASAGVQGALLVSVGVGVKPIGAGRVVESWAFFFVVLPRRGYARYRMSGRLLGHQLHGVVVVE